MWEMICSSGGFCQSTLQFCTSVLRMMGVSVQVANFGRIINQCSFFCVPEEAWRRENVFLPGDICLCHSDRKSWWINQPEKTKTKQKARRVRKLMAKEKTVRILYVSGLWLPFHKQPSSYLCIIYLNILFLSSSCVWLWDFEKGWSLRKVSSIVYWEKVEASLLKLRNV